MRNLFFCLLILHSFNMLPQSINAQPAPVRNPIPKTTPDSLVKMFVGAGSGLEYFSGMIGAIAGYKITDNLLLKAGLGIGGWGSKFSAGIRYDFKKGNTWGLGLSYSSCSGLNNYNTSMEVINDRGEFVTQTVHLALLRTGTINFTIARKWLVKKKHELCLEGGYCAPIEVDPYRVLDGSVLTPTSKATLRLQQPGGFHMILGLSFLFGIR